MSDSQLQLNNTSLIQVSKRYSNSSQIKGNSQYMELGRQENQSFLLAKPEKHGQHIVRLMW